MLEHLEISNLALIEEASLDIAQGFQVITGETGTGKSLLLGAISAISGKTLAKDLVRTGEEISLVDAVFQDVEKYFDGNEEVLSFIEDGELILSREIRKNGRNLCRVNGRMVSLNFLREIGERLCDIHGQNDKQQIFRKEKHMDILDRYGQVEISEAKQAFRRAYKAWQELLRKEKELLADPEERRLLMERLAYQINEIEMLDPKPDEDTSLKNRRDILLHTEKLSLGLGQVLTYINGGEEQLGAKDLINASWGEVQGLAPYYENLSKEVDNLGEISALLEESSRNLDKLLQSIEQSPQELDHIQERLDAITRLKKKYGGAIDTVLLFLEKAKERYQLIEEASSLVDEIQERKEKLKELLEDRGKKLHEKRQEVALVLENKIMAELKALGMEDAIFQVRFRTRGIEEVRENGFDQIEFMLSANKGESLKPLAETASGGEASRIMLAIKVTLADADDTPLLVFDEIDSGISGETTEIVGEKLKRLGQTHQIICVTHQAQIAAKADHHFHIYKESDGDRTRTKIERLNPERRIKEIARLLSGKQEDSSTLQLAKELLNA